LDAYKISHHGSRGNNSSDLLRLVRCRNYLFSTSGSRFHHPHDECVARVLVEGGKELCIYSNYLRGADVLWNFEEVRKQYKHIVKEPETADAGITIDLN
jgi:hypothetical protein